MTAARRLRSLAAGPALLLAAALVPACSAPAGPDVAPADFLADVTWLADDARGGRDTGTPELFETADWVAERFEEAGLLPFGDDGSYLQHFTVSGRQQLVDGNALTLGGDALALRRDWIPLQSALRGTVEGEVVFAGYGIADPEGGRDDYADLDVKDKVVLVLRHGPHWRDRDSRYAQDAPGGAHITFSSKVNAAFRRGAAALLVVNDPASTTGGRDDRTFRYRSLGPDVTASLPAAHVSLRGAREMLAEHGLDLAAAQAALDAGGRPAPDALRGLTARLAIAAEQPQIDTVNVVGLLPGSDPALAGEYVLIGAHMDHLGRAEHTSSRDARGAGQIHNGADDNASGTAGVVQIARVLAAREERPRRSIVFATWSGEEWGLLGSKHFAAHPPMPLSDLVAALNMDMIGRSEQNKVTVEGMGTSPGFQALVTDAAAGLAVPLDLRFADVPSGNSDQASFFERDVPVINFFTGLHADYHMPSDDIERINAPAGAAIATLAGRVVARLANEPGRPAFTSPVPKAAPAVAAAPGDPHAGGPGGEPGGQPIQAYRVVFGTSPDMAYGGDDGVLLASVRADTPAERAGLKGGDRIVAFDGKPVRNLQDYSVLLFSHKPGDTVSVTVVRGEETLELSAVLEGQHGQS